MGTLSAARDNPLSLTLDLQADAAAEIATVLRNLGYSAPTASDLDATLVRYLNVNHRMIASAPHTVRWSTQLRTRALPPSLDSVVKEIVRKAEAGEDLRPFQSRLLADADFDDMLMNDWGVNHLHLGGTSPEANGLVKRSNELLYVFERGAELLLLDVLDHKSFVDDALIGILHADWPHVLEPFRLRGFTNVSRVSQAERKVLRASGVSTVFETADGSLYLSPGGGHATSKLSLAVRFRVDRFLRAIRDLDDWARSSPETIRDEIAKHTQPRPDALHLRLRFDHTGRVRLVDDTTNIQIVTDVYL